MTEENIESTNIDMSMIFGDKLDRGVFALARGFHVVHFMEPEQRLRGEWFKIYLSGDDNIPNLVPVSNSGECLINKY